MNSEQNHCLLSNNTFGINVSCQRFIEIDTVEEATKLPSLLSPLSSLLTTHSSLLIIGGGSNMLFTRDFPGTVVRSAIRGIETTADGTDIYVRAGSGETWDNVVALCVENGWHGMENLSLIPGDVGASAVQNIGAYGSEVSHIIYNVEAVDLTNGEIVTFANSDCGYAYRQSRFKQDWKGRYLITHVTYRLSTVFSPRLDYGNIRDVLGRHGIDMPTPQQLRQAIIDIRREKLPDPAVEGNAGSFFMNPVVSREKFEELLRDHPQMPHYAVDTNGNATTGNAANYEKIPAGWLIEQCGWKGRTLGRAGVHSRQALVLVNRGGATGADILQLCEAIRHDVKAKFGIDLKPEVNII